MAASSARSWERRTPVSRAYVALPHAGKGMAASYLGVAYNPFETLGDPSDEKFSVRNLKLPSGLTIEQLDHRMAHAQAVRSHAPRHRRLRLDRGHGCLHAAGLESGHLASRARGLQYRQEDPKLRDRYGRHDWGQNMLLARRLVEAGVRFVTVDIGGWDTHGNNFETLKKRLLPKFDQSFATLIEDLDQRGRLDNTLVLVWGEFGRTPRINAGSGRDHWPNVLSVVMAGGGLKRGIVLGESDPRAEFPKERPLLAAGRAGHDVSPAGNRSAQTFTNDANRPVEILNYGEPIHEILA